MFDHHQVRRGNRCSWAPSVSIFGQLLFASGQLDPPVESFHAKPCTRSWRQRPSEGIAPWLRFNRSLYRRNGPLNGAELGHYLRNKNRDLSLRMCVEARAGIEPACKDLQSSA